MICSVCIFSYVYLYVHIVYPVEKFKINYNNCVHSRKRTMLNSPEAGQNCVVTNCTLVTVFNNIELTEPDFK